MIRRAAPALVLVAVVLVVVVALLSGLLAWRLSAQAAEASARPNSE